jgi:hypothetical protein
LSIKKITESRGSLMRLSACVLAVAVLSPIAARAQTPAEAPPPAAPPPAAPVAPPPAAPAPAEAAPAPAAAAPPAKTWKDLLTVEGLVDTYYLYNFTGSNSLVPPGGRQFDTNSNTFTLNYAKVGLGVAADPVGLRIDLGYGATGQIINGALASDMSTEAFLVQQAYATVVPVAGLTLDFGKFVTTAGAEVIEANKNWMYSRSILFFNIPLLHTGIRATYQASKELILQASVVNGWNGTGISTDVTKDKTFGVSLNYTVPGVGTNIIATGYFGKGEAGGADTRILADLVVAHTLGNLALNLNVDYVKEGTVIDNFIGVAPMIHYTISDHLTFSLRAEFAKQGDLKVYEGTANIGVPFGGRFEGRFELRDDYSSINAFDPPGMLASKKNQTTGTLAFLAWF